jgi:hypothetical protein
MPFLLTMRSLLFCCLTAALWAGCSSPPPPKTSLELQAMQAREVEGSKAIAFAAVISVFQDLGYVISSADVTTGFLTAKSPTRGHKVFLGPNKMDDTKATAFVEDMPNGKARVRLSFVYCQRVSSKKGRLGENETPVEDPLVYQKVFERVDEGVFLRKATK